MSRTAARILEVDAVHARGLLGSGEMIAVCDTGLDRGDPNAPHPFISASRVKTLLAYQRKQADDPHGHGTHVIGCIVADPDPSSGPVRGIAPGARVIVQSVFRTIKEPFGNRPVDLHKVLAEAHSRGARIHSNSWIQINSTSEYSDTAQAIDRFVFEHPDLVVITAVGNEGGFADRSATRPNERTVRSPAVAKNVISVGASENELPALSRTYAQFFRPDQLKRLPDVFHSDSWGDNAQHWAPFSGVGPTADMRIKPDLLAPGTAIVSTRSRSGFVKSIWGEAVQPDCAILGGTSVAAPLVAGACALTREHLRQLGVVNPSAAAIKAVLINGAAQDVQLLRDQAVLPFPNVVMGWGRLALATALGFGDLKLALIDEGQALSENGVFRVRVPLDGSPHQLRVTLAWTDPPGRGLRSDLDLIVTTSADHTGNAPGIVPRDDVNNVEQVRVEMAAGLVAAEVRVQAARLRDGPQRFALAILGRLTGPLQVIP